jgi:predicted deacylase
MLANVSCYLISKLFKMKTYLSYFWLVIASFCLKAHAQPVRQSLDLDAIPANSKAYFWVTLLEDGLGEPVNIPVMVAKGKQPGKILGVQAAIHGNELNGIAVIQRVFSELDPAQLTGTVVGIPVVNAPALRQEDRLFPDQTDLNRVMPGKANGNRSQLYAHRYLERVASHVDFMLDLHTASFGRVNAHYVRADLSLDSLAALAPWLGADIILNSKEASTASGSGTLRAVLTSRGIPTLTIELGDPQVWQENMISRGVSGLKNALIFFGLQQGDVEKGIVEPYYCARSYWLYTDTGGFLEVLPAIAEEVEEGQKIAVLRNAFGEVLKEYTAPERGIVIGKSTNPVSQAGSRIIHLGIPS